MLSYTQATSSVLAGLGLVFACRTVGAPTWPDTKYIGLSPDGTEIWVYYVGETTGSLYDPTQDDIDGMDWIKGGDRPPTE
jgi:hypothetical protein